MAPVALPCEVLGYLSGRTRAAHPSSWGVDLDELHHPEILVVQDVAVQDEAAGEILEAGADGHAAKPWHVDGIAPDRLGERLTIDPRHLEGVGVDVIGMVGVVEIDDRPLLHRPEAYALVDPVGVKLPTIDEEREIVEVVPSGWCRRVEGDLAPASELVVAKIGSASGR